MSEMAREAWKNGYGMWDGMAYADPMSFAGDNPFAQTILTRAIDLAKTGCVVTEEDWPILAPALDPSRQLGSLCSGFVYYVGKYLEGQVRNDPAEKRFMAGMAEAILATLYQLTFGVLACDDCAKTATVIEGLNPRFRSYVDCEVHRDARWQQMSDADPVSVRAPWASAT